MQPLVLPEHLSSPPVFDGVRVSRCLVFHVVFCISLFVSVLLATVLSGHLRFTASVFPFGIFKLFLKKSVWSLKIIIKKEGDWNPHVVYICVRKVEIPLPL